MVKYISTPTCDLQVWCLLIKYVTTLAIFTFYVYISGLVTRVPDYRSRGPVFDSRHYQIFWEVVDLERDLLGLVSTTSVNTVALNLIVSVNVVKNNREHFHLS
jgi:hypothetical protein